MCLNYTLVDFNKKLMKSFGQMDRHCCETLPIKNQEADTLNKEMGEGTLKDSWFEFCQGLEWAIKA
jgi:hypothetical protein